MLKLIRFTHHDLVEIVNNVPDTRDSVKDLFKDILTNEDCTYIEFAYNTMIHHNRLYKEPDFPCHTPIVGLQSKTLVVDVFDLMLSGYLLEDCPLSDKYSTFMYDGLMESIEDLHGKVLGDTGDPAVEYEHKVRMEHLMGILEIVTVIDDYIESILKSALLGFGDIPSVVVTIAHDGDYLYLVLSDELSSENSWYH